MDRHHDLCPGLLVILQLLEADCLEVVEHGRGEARPALVVNQNHPYRA